MQCSMSSRRKRKRVWNISMHMSAQGGQRKNRLQLRAFQYAVMLRMKEAPELQHSLKAHSPQEAQKPSSCPAWSSSTKGLLLVAGSNPSPLPAIVALATLLSQGMPALAFYTATAGLIRPSSPSLARKHNGQSGKEVNIFPLYGQEK